MGSYYEYQFTRQVFDLFFSLVRRLHTNAVLAVTKPQIAEWIIPISTGNPHAAVSCAARVTDESTGVIRTIEVTNEATRGTTEVTTTVKNESTETTVVIMTGVTQTSVGTKGIEGTTLDTVIHVTRTVVTTTRWFNILNR